MADKLTHHNLQSNPHAAYLFIEGRANIKAKIILTKTKEEKDGPALESLRRKEYADLKGKIIWCILRLTRFCP